MKVLLSISIVFFLSSNTLGQQLNLDHTEALSEPVLVMLPKPRSLYQNDLRHLDYMLDSLNTSTLETKGQSSSSGAGKAILAVVIGHIQKEDHRRALHLIEEALLIYEQADYKKGQGNVYYLMGIIYERQGKFDQGIKYLRRAVGLFKKNKHTIELGHSLKKLGDVHIKINNHQQALQYYLESMGFLTNEQEEHIGQLHLEVGKIYSILGDRNQALYHFDQSLRLNKIIDQKHLEADVNNHIGVIYIQQGVYDSAFLYLELAYQMALDSGHLTLLNTISKNLFSLHENQSEHEKALAYHKVLNATNDSLERQQKQVQQLQINNDHVFAMEVLQYQNLIKKERLLLGLSLLGLITAVVFIVTLAKNYQKKKQAFAMLEDKNEEILKNRNQMITQEKMASLGQLAAGIAHEIKNPLNFINNFAEGSIELAEELAGEVKNKKLDIQPEDFDDLWDIIDNIKQNSSDISRNGKRADQIVCSMMEYARGNEAEFQAIDINQLIEQNLNMALLASSTNDYSLNVTIQKEFDYALGLIEVIPQDLGRVLINLVNNAFYAMREKGENDPSFVPTLQIKTSASNNQVNICIRDNGTGIPSAIRTKVFTPFYTSKPPNSGNTGLGLSISYEIVVTRHQGSLELDSEPGKFTEIKLQLPMVQDEVFKSTAKVGFKRLFI